METEDRFHHHPYLRPVALYDVTFLLERDRSYGASWKAAGGRSAWFMLRRKMDRLLELMSPPPDPPQWSDPETWRRFAQGQATPAAIQHLAACCTREDIFAAICSQPGGEDGSALAEVRDLRCYLLLVEAEMVARGVVAVADEGSGPTSYRVDPGDVPAILAEFWHCSRGDALARLTRWVKELAQGDLAQLVERGLPRLEDGLRLMPDYPIIRVEDPLCNGSIYYLADRSSIDPDHWSHLPRLGTDINHKEWLETLPEYRALYRRTGEHDKYLMLEQYREHWGLEP